MRRSRILFQGSHKPKQPSRIDTPEQLRIAQPMAEVLGEAIIRGGLELVLTDARSLDATVAKSAISTCEQMGLNPNERIRTYTSGPESDGPRGFGMVLEALDQRFQEVRTFVVQESDAVVALCGGKGTSDAIQKAVLARKPVFPIAVAGGAGRVEWERLKRSQYFNHSEGDIDFLADSNMALETMAATVVSKCRSILATEPHHYSRRIFVAHGHDSGLKNELARLLERLDFVPVILRELPDRGSALISKLHAEVADVGFAFILLTPDDLGAAASTSPQFVARARQNVVFEHGLLVGLLDADRVCAIVKGDLEVPSDLQGVLFKKIPDDGSLQSVVMDIISELRAAGYEVDANKL